MEIKEVEFTDITISFIPDVDRDHPKDCYRISSPGRGWVVTARELWDFYEQLGDLLTETDDVWKRNNPGPGW